MPLSGKPFQPGFTFASKSRAYPSRTFTMLYTIVTFGLACEHMASLRQLAVDANLLFCLSINNEGKKVF